MNPEDSLSLLPSLNSYLQFHQVPLNPIFGGGGNWELIEPFNFDFAAKNFVPNRGSLTQLKQLLKRKEAAEQKWKKTLLFSILSSSQNKDNKITNKEIKIYKEVLTLLLAHQFEITAEQIALIQSVDIRNLFKTKGQK